ncbi:DUF6287 domain-containing protein [Streptococcus salivarius]
MKNTSKLIGIVAALIVVILAIFLVTKFNSHESARVSTSSSPVKTVKKSSSSSSKAVKKDKKNSNPHVKNEDTKDETVEVSESSVAKDSATKDTDETVLSSGGVSEPTKEKTGEETQSSSSSFNGKQLSSGDYSSIAGTWTNSRGEFVTISPDGTVQNGSGYTYHLYSGHLNNGNFSGTIASDIDSAAFWAIPGTGNGDSDHLVIGQSDDAENYPFYRN